MSTYGPGLAARRRAGYGPAVPEMTPAQRQVYTVTAGAAQLLHHLDEQGALAVPAREAAASAVRFYDDLAETGGWPNDWREMAHVDLLDLADA
jgi:hypothetical protein